MRWSRAATLLLAAVAACSGNGGPPTNQSTDYRSAPLRVTDETTLPIDDGEIASLVTWGHYVAWAAADPGTDERRVVVLDLNTRRTRAVAEAPTAAAIIDYVRGSGDTIVYPVLDRIPDDTAPGGLAVPYRVYALDLLSGERREIDRNRNASSEDAILPSPIVEWPWIVDASLPKAGNGLEFYLYDLRTGKRTTVIGPASGIGGASITEETIVWFARSGLERSDLFAMPVNGPGDPRQLSNSGAVSGPEAANGAVSWMEPMTGEPQGLWWIPLTPGASPVQFATSGYNPYPGKGFVVWLSGDSLVAADPTGTAEPLVLAKDNLDLGARYCAWGDRVVWATRRENGRITIHIGRLVAANS